MVRQTWRRLFAVAIASLAFAVSASAQQIGSPVPDTSAAPVTLPVEPAAAYRLNGHLATASRGFVMQSTGQYLWSNCPNGANCNNGAGSFSADFGFAFGPTKSFFAPCGPRVLPDCGGMYGHKCRTPIYGRGPCGPWQHCTYDSYMNH